MKLILVTASRTWHDRVPIIGRLTAVHKRFGYCTLISGHCPEGGDALAEQTAIELGWDLELYPANWNRYGRRAGIIRNAKMVARPPDWCLAFIHNNSPGATGCLRLAVQAKIKHRVWRIND